MKKKNTGYVANTRQKHKSQDSGLTNFRILPTSWEGEQRMREGMRRTRKTTKTVSAKLYCLQKNLQQTWQHYDIC